MKILLYIPPFQVEGTHVDNIAQVRIGGLTLYERACRSANNARFDEIIVAGPKNVNFADDPLVKIPVTRLDYETRVSEIKTKLAELMGDEDACICRVDGMIGPVAISMRPQGGDVRIRANGEESGIYFLTGMSVQKAILSDTSLDELSSTSYETLDAPEKTIYHRILSSEDLKIGQNILTRSLRKKLGRDADGLVAYYINRPCSLQISKRIANSPITPNMVTLFGLIVGLAGAVLIAYGGYVGATHENGGNSWALMAIAVILWQFSSMVDGVDGELARMRMSPSHRGEWFDTVADDVTNIAFLFGLGFANAMLHPLPEPVSMPWPAEILDSALHLLPKASDGITLFDAQGGFHFPYLIVTSIVCALMTIVVCWFYREFLKLGIASHNHFEWGFEKENKSNKLDEHRGPVRRALDMIAGGFAWVAKRDFYTFMFMCLIICGFNRIAYFIMLGGASCVGIGGICALTIRAIRNASKNKKSKKEN